MTVKDTGRQIGVYNDVAGFDQAISGTLTVITTAGTYNPVTGTTSGAATTAYDVQCVFKKVSKNEAIPENYVLSDTQNYRAVVLASKGIVPNKTGILTLLGQTYTILGSVESSGGDDALFTVYLKKGI